MRNCPNVLVSQFNVNVLLMVDNPACELVKINRELVLRGKGIAKITVDEDPQQQAPRAKLFYMVIERALRNVLIA